MDQPTYTPVQKIVEGSGTLFFSFRTSTRQAGRIRQIRVETVAYYSSVSSADIMQPRSCRPKGPCPLLGQAV